MLFVYQWLFLTLLGIQNVAVFSCSCNPHSKHPQNHFCDASFVVKATILGQKRKQKKKKGKGWIQYKVDILHVYKTPIVFQKGATVRTGKANIRSPLSCSAMLITNGIYLITGKARSSKNLETTFCNWNPFYVAVTAEQEKGLREGYKKSCRCQVLQCTTGPGTCKSGRRTCVIRWDFPYSFIGQCYFSHGVCLRNQRTRTCALQDNPTLRRCIADQHFLLEEGSGGYQEEDKDFNLDDFNVGL